MIKFETILLIKKMKALIEKLGMVKRNEEGDLKRLGTKVGANRQHSLLLSSLLISLKPNWYSLVIVIASFVPFNTLHGFMLRFRFDFDVDTSAFTHGLPLFFTFLYLYFLLSSKIV